MIIHFPKIINLRLLKSSFSQDYLLRIIMGEMELEEHQLGHFND